jgi:VCBS repeat-containing protein
LYDQGLIRFTFTDGTVAQDVSRNAYRSLSLNGYSTAQKGKVVSGIEVEGSSGTDTITGTHLGETIKAGSGDDLVIGGGGADVQTGGRGKDTFAYTAAGDSANAAGRFDTITDFKASEGDRIDLSALGQITWGGQKAVGGGTASAWYTVSGSTASLFIDTDGNGSADMRIDLKGVTSIAQSDLIGVSSPTTPPTNPPEQPSTNAKPDTASITEDARSGLVSGNVLSNDASGLQVSTVNGQKVSALLKLASVKGQHGTLTMGQDGKWVYTLNNKDAAVQALGVDGTLTETFTYVAAGRNGATATSTLTVTIKGSNDGPVAAKDTATTPEDAAVDIAVLANDTDKDSGDTLTVTSASITKGAGLVSINADGTIHYDPNGKYDSLAPGKTAQVVITYKISDGKGGTSTATATVTVTGKDKAPLEPKAPVAVDDTATVAEDGTVTIDVLANDTDADGPSMTLVTATVPEAQGTAAIVGNKVVFTPAKDFNGTATITYTVSDGVLTDEGQAVVTVTPVNDMPVAGNDAFSTDEDSPLTFQVAELLKNDSVGGNDAGQTLSLSGIGQPANGKATINADGTITYTPNPDFHGTDTFTYTMTDGQGSGSVATGTITVTVAPGNDAPTAEPVSVKGNEGSPVTGKVTGLDGDGDILGYKLAADGAPKNGSVTVEADGSFTYQGNKDFHGNDSFSVEVSDGKGNTVTTLVSVTVDPVNDAPVAVDDAAEVAEGGSVAIDVLGNDTDVDNSGLTLLDPSVPAGQGMVEIVEGKIKFTAAKGFNGTATITYTVSDGNLSDVGQALVSVTEVDDAPVAQDGSASSGEDTVITGSVTATDADTDAKDLTYSVVEGPDSAKGTLAFNTDGTYAFTPAVDFHGTVTFTYKANDGTSDSEPATVTLIVEASNDAPVAGADTYTVPARGAYQGASVLGNDTDAENGQLTARLHQDAGKGNLVLNPDGTFTYTPSIGASGTDEFWYVANDGTSDSEPVKVTITIEAPLNEAPVAAEDTFDVVLTDGSFTSTASLLANDTDAESDALTAVIGSEARFGTVTINPDGTFTYTLADGADRDPAFDGTDEFHYYAKDAGGQSQLTKVSLTGIRPAELPNVSIGDASAPESAASIDIPVTLSTATTQDVTLSYEVTLPGKVIGFDGTESGLLPANYEGVRWSGILGNGDGTAIVATDGGEFHAIGPNGFSVAALTITAPFANQMSGGQTVTIQAIKDGSVVGTKTVHLGNGGATSAPVTFGPEFAGIDSVRLDAAEGTTSGSSYDAPFNIDKVTLGGSQPTKGTLVIEAGKTAGTISVPVTDDNVYEVGEKVVVKLVDADGAALGEDVEGIGTINDDDAQPLPRVEIVNAVEGRVEEGGLGVWFELTRDSHIDEELTVYFESEVFGNFHVTFPVGVNRIENIELSLTEDTIDNGTRPYEIRIAENGSYIPSGKTSLTGTAVDNDGNSAPEAYPLTFTIDEDTIAADGFEFNGQGYDNQQWNLSYEIVEQPTEWGTVVLTDVDYGYGPVFKFIPHEGVLEHLNDGDTQAITFKYVAKDGVGGVSEPATVTINVGGISDDYVAPTVSIGDVTVSDGPSEDGSGQWAIVKVTLSQPSSRDIAVSYDMVGGTAVAYEDYSPASGTVYIPAGQTEAEIAIPIWEDTDLEGNETIEIVLSNPVNATIPDGGGKGTVTITDGEPGGGGVDPDAPGIIIEHTDGSTAVAEAGVNGGGANDTIMISLSSAPTADVTVMVMGDYWQVSPNPDDLYGDLYLTFTPENWNVPQAVTVTALGDSDEEDGSGALYVSTLESADPRYSYFYPTNGYVPVTVTESGGGGSTGNTPPSVIDVATDTYDTALSIDVEGFGYDQESGVTYEIVTQPAEGKVTLVDGKFHFEGNAELQTLSRGQIKPVTFQYRVVDAEGAVSEPAKITINVHGTNPGDETIQAFTRTTPSQTDFFPLDGKEGNDTVVFKDVTLTEGTGLEISLGKTIKWTEYDGKALVNIENITINGTEGNNLRTMTVGGDAQVNVITIENTSHKLLVNGRGGNDTINIKGTTGNGQNTEVNVADGNDTVNVSGGASVRITNFSAGDRINFADGIQASDVTSAVQGSNTVFTINKGGVTSTVTVVGATALVAGTDWTAEGGVVVEPAAPTMSIGDVTVNDTAGTATFVVKLSAAATTAISVDYNTALGTASDGALTPQSGTVTFVSGETEKTITVPINDGALATGAVATFNVELTNATGGVTVADAQAEGTIVGAEPDTTGPTLPTISISDAEMNEGGLMNFKLTLSEPPTERMTVTYEVVHETTDAGDVSVGTYTLFIARDHQGTRGFNIQTIHDLVPEANETFKVKLLSVKTNGGVDAYTIVDGEGVGTILNNDGDVPVDPEPTVPTLSIGDVTVTEGDTATFTVTLSAAAAVAVTVGYTVNLGTAQAGSVEPVTGLLTFEPGQTTATIDVPVAGNTVADAGTQRFNVTLTNPQGATIADVVGTIVDDDLPTEVTPLAIATTTGLDENSTISWNAIPGAASYVLIGVEPDEPNFPPHTLGFAVAPNTSYAIGGNDEFTGMVVRVEARDAQGNVIARSENQTDLIANVNDVPTGRPVISDNTPEVGQLLTISIGDLEDGDGMRSDRPDEFSYIWQRSTDNGATWNLVGSGDAYTVTQADVGHLIRGAAQYTDRGDLLEVVHSLPTAIVGDPNPNTPPVAFDDAAETPMGQSIAIDARSNDFDFEGDATVIETYGQGRNGTVTVQEGKLLYTPNANFVGIDTFEYTLNGGDTAKVTVTVTQEAEPLTLLTVDGLDENSTLSWTPVPGAVSYVLIGLEPDDLAANPHELGFALAPATSFAINGDDEFTGMVIHVEARDAAGNVITRSVNSTGLIENINDVPTGNLSISDMTPEVGQTLTLGYGTFEDGDAYRDRGREDEFGWAFERSLDGVTWTTITTGASAGKDGPFGFSYTVTQADDGHFLRGRAIYEDRAGDTIETVYSLSTSRVGATDTGGGDTGGGDGGGDGGGGEPIPGSVTIGLPDGPVAATEAGANGTFTLVLKDAPTSNVTVNVSGDDQVYAFGPDGSSSDLVFTPENWNIPQTVTVVASEDGVKEGPHEGNLYFMTTSADPRYEGLMLDEILPVTITDSAPEPAMPYVTVANLGGDVTEGGEITFTFHRSDVSDGDLAIIWTQGGSIGPDDIQAIKWNGVEGGFEGFRGSSQRATVTFVLKDDAAVEGPEDLTVTVESSPLYIYDDPFVATGTVLDNDEEAPAVLPEIGVSGPAAGVAEGGAITYTFTRTGNTDASLDVQYILDGDATAGSDFTSPSGTVTFAAGSATATVTVQTTDDAADEADETVGIVVQDNSSYTVSQGSATATIIDNDDPVVTPPTNQTITATTTASAFTGGAGTDMLIFPTTSGTGTPMQLSAGENTISLGGTIVGTPYAGKAITDIENITLDNVGGPTGRTLTVNGDANANQINVKQTNKTIMINAGDGDDAINFTGSGLEGGASVLRGGTGNDVVSVTSTAVIDDRVDSGLSGDDTFHFSGGRQEARFGDYNGDDTVWQFSTFASNRTSADKLNFIGLEAEDIVAQEVSGNTEFSITQADGSVNKVTVMNTTGMVFGTDWIIT